MYNKNSERDQERKTCSFVCPSHSVSLPLPTSQIKSKASFQPLRNWILIDYALSVENYYTENVRALFRNYLDEQAWGSSKGGEPRSDMNDVSPVRTQFSNVPSCINTYRKHIHQLRKTLQKQRQMTNKNDSQRRVGFPFRWKA